ncbi:response regulator transcription factor [Silvibacterium dinghuense]|uniref:Response regulator transcription factor n=1 Tax=Silvibacterium dinghuense TaxID=1560006 RepID=A0A4Q1SFP6_9BACT|nr:response regulator transcription factor [Silvibacterium dinghuense]RXS96411.1 response regulator transcription factor [Silvibacterium dinghuense]GGG90559.1 DNA-binding response regulator [Silvibacterium dinghuense]
MNVLLIEDDKRIAGLVERGLREEGHSVSTSYDGIEGAAMMLGGEYDAALLDVYLPGMDGFQVLETVRARHCRTPILMLTAVDAVPKVLKAFDLGADDYLVKPFLLKILLARIGAIARRAQPVQSPLLQAAGVTLDSQRRLAIRNGRQIPLTRKQTELLDVLMRRSGLVTSREELIEAAWDDANGVKENTLDVYIHSLRTKLEDRSETKPLIRTVHGTGYIFVVE